MQFYHLPTCSGRLWEWIVESIQSLNFKFLIQIFVQLWPLIKNDTLTILKWWLRLTKFQGINFAILQIWILTWCIKRQTIAGGCQQTFWFQFSWSKAKHDKKLSSLPEWAQKFKFLVWGSNSMNWSSGCFTFTTKRVQLKFIIIKSKKI